MQDELAMVRDLARRELYAFISIATADPAARENRLDDLTTTAVLNCALELIHDDAQFHPASLGPDEIDPARLTLRLPGRLETAIHQEYEAVFGYCSSKNCPPYETEYCALKDIHFRSQQMADVAGFYRVFGLKPSSKVHDRLDHISLETEFMAILITRQLHALHQDLCAEAAEVCYEAQRAFFKDHLGWWLPAFGVRLMKEASGFYKIFGKLICAFIPAERAFFGLPPMTRIPVAEPHLHEEMECASNCALGADPHLSTFCNPRM